MYLNGDFYIDLIIIIIIISMGLYLLRPISAQKWEKATNSIFQTDKLNVLVVWRNPNQILLVLLTKPDLDCVP